MRIAVSTLLTAAGFALLTAIPPLQLALATASTSDAPVGPHRLTGVEWDFLPKRVVKSVGALGDSQVVWFRLKDDRLFLAVANAKCPIEPGAVVSFPDDPTDRVHGQKLQRGSVFGGIEVRPPGQPYRWRCFLGVFREAVPDPNDQASESEGS